MNITIPKGTIIYGIKEIGEPDIVLKEDLVIPIKMSIVYETDVDDINIHLCRSSIKGLEEEILQDLKFSYNFYGKYENDENLTDGAIDLKRKMLDIFDEIDTSIPIV